MDPMMVFTAIFVPDLLGGNEQWMHLFIIDVVVDRGVRCYAQAAQLHSESLAYQQWLMTYDGHQKNWTLQFLDHINNSRVVSLIL